VALADTLSVLDDRVQLTVGVRRQNIQSDNYNATGVVTTSYDDGRTTPLYGVVIKPWDHVSFYYNYIEGLSKGDIAPSTASNAGEIFCPLCFPSARTRRQGRLRHLHLHPFPVPDHQTQRGTGLRGVCGAGQQRNRGLELNVFGEVAPGTRLLGGVTLLDAQLSKPRWLATVAINRLAYPVQANLWAERDASWLEGLTLTAGAIHTGSQYVNQANTQKLDDWTRFDVGARYTTLIDERPTTFAPPCRTCSTRRTGRAWPPTARSPRFTAHFITVGNCRFLKRSAG
jgi:iron complex outermembrane receptor protein